MYDKWPILLGRGLLGLHQQVRAYGQSNTKLFTISSIFILTISIDIIVFSISILMHIITPSTTYYARIV